MANMDEIEKGVQGFVVTQEIENARLHDDYVLLEGDLLTLQPDGSFWKVCPGISLGGFFLTDDQTDTLKGVRYIQRHLKFAILEDKA